MSRTKTQIKKEFDDFAGKIARLESLRQQLNALDTRGFETEAGLIRAKLKDINAISRITREINDLRRKIEKRHIARPVVSRENKKEHRKLIENAASMKKKIDELQRLINKKRKISVRKQLNDKELRYVGDIPKLERELEELTEMFRNHTSSSRIKVDSGVGVIVDSKFDDFVSAIKGEISEKLREKERAADSVLEHDLEKQKKMFIDKYNSLAREFQEKYEHAVNTRLKEEVKKKFSVELSKRIDAEKKKVIVMLMRQNARRLAEDRKKAREVLQGHYSKMEKELARSIEEKRKALEERVQNLKKKEKEIVSRAEGRKAEVNRVKEKYRKMEREELARFEGFRKQEESNFRKNLENERKKLKAEEKKLISSHLDAKKRLEEEEKALRRKYSERQSALGSRSQALKDKFASLIRREESDKEKEQRMKKEMGKSRERMNMELESARERMGKELKEIKDRNDRMIRARKEELERKGQRERIDFEKGMKEKELALARRMAEMKELEKKDSFIIEQKKKALEGERREIEFRRGSFKKQEEKKFAEMEKKERHRMDEELRRVKESLQKQYSERVAKISREHDAVVSREVSAKEKEIRADMEKELKGRLNEERMKQEDKLRKKKQEIEKHIMEQARNLFG